MKRKLKRVTFDEIQEGQCFKHRGLWWKKMADVVECEDGSFNDFSCFTSGNYYIEL